MATAGEVTAIVATAVAPPRTPAATPSIRAIVLNPSRYLDQKVTVTGQFDGRNLLGDLPDAPGRSRYDFVLRSQRRRHLGHQHAAEAKDATARTSSSASTRASTRDAG